jgi:hypothetical protein
MTGEIARKGDKAPIQAGQRWHVERANARHNSFSRLQRCYERNEDVIDAFFVLADAFITVGSLIRRAWTLYRFTDGTAARRGGHDHLPIRASTYSLGVAGAPPLAFSMAEDGSVRRLGCADQRCV